MPGRGRSGIQQAAGAADYRPQLATLVDSPPHGDNWLHEVKYDGYRIGCLVQGQRVTLISRRGNDWTAQFPEIADAARALPASSALLDGEVAALLPDGRTSFQDLQNAFSGGKRPRLVYFVFDLLSIEGDDIAHVPLEERKAALERLLAGLPEGNPIRYAQHWRGNGPVVFREACRLGFEGVVSKRRDQAYDPGRHGGWLKAKCFKRQEFVIGGFTDPEGSRQGIGALLVGFFDAQGKFVFAGKVGTGFTQQSAREMRDRLEALEIEETPFAVRPAGWLGRNAHWVRPELVAEVRFAEWTGDGLLRHPSFYGLRQDKPPREVGKEQPSTAAPPSPAPKPKRRKGEELAEVAGVRISHPERVVFPEIGLTKLQLARYYESIADWILPHLEGRPLTLFHCPEGIGGECRFMKHSKVWAPELVRRVRIQEKTKLGEYLVIDALPALIGVIQMDVVELHTWNSRTEHVEQPDRVVLDLDPGPQVPWPQVVEAARLVRAAFEALGLESFVKTTGGVGLHVVAPLVPERDWSECLAFSRGLARTIARQQPETFTTASARRGREGKILLDYLRNNRTNTSVAAFSTRARPQAPVSVPIEWDELRPSLRSDQFTVANLPRRLTGLRADPWRRYWTTRQRLAASVIRALSREGAGTPQRRRSSH